jgi:hypothetical protein
MDDKTAELRDIFVDATGSDTVTERQEEGPGSLASADESAVGPRLREVIAAMRERYGFETGLDVAGLESVVRGFYRVDGDDAALAAWLREEADLDVDAAAVFEARTDLHLVRPSDRDVPYFDDLRRLVVDGADDGAVRAALSDRPAAPDDVDAATVARLRRVVETDIASTRASDRFRDEFEELLTDAELSGTLARDAREDGLREATEDIETDVSL